MGFKVEKVLILEDRPDLARMVVTWSAVDHDLDGDDLLDDWAVLAGVPRRVVEKNRLLLLRLGIIGDGGQVEAMAMAVVQQMAVRLIKGRRSP